MQRDVIVLSPVTVRQCMAAACEYYGVRVDDVTGTRRFKYISIPRHVGMFLARRLTAKSFPQIGLQFEKDHTSVMHAVQKVASDPDMLEAAREICSNLRQDISKLGDLKQGRVG